MRLAVGRLAQPAEKAAAPVAPARVRRKERRSVIRGMGEIMRRSREGARETLIEDTRAGGHVDRTNRIAQRETGDRMIGCGDSISGGWWRAEGVEN